MALRPVNNDQSFGKEKRTVVDESRTGPGISRLECPPCANPCRRYANGPCPPPNDHPHRYIFTVFAVSSETLPVAADTSAAIVGFNLNFNTLAKATLMGLFKR
jgi:phosphatidylethanolamine-binding protein (PEBP) family uncharacterized protein